MTEEYIKKLDDLSVIFFRFIRNISYVIGSRLFFKKYVHVIGDSHTHSFEGDAAFFVHHIAPATAYNLHKVESTTNSYRKLCKILNYMHLKRDSIVLVFGEIDCRIHVYNQFKKQNETRSLSTYIDKTIENYMKVLDMCNDMGIIFWVYGIPPASKQENVYGYEFYAPPEVRVQINNEFNEKLKHGCVEKGYKYIDIYSKTVDKEGYIKKEYSMDDIHLNKRIIPYVKDCMANNL